MGNQRWAAMVEAVEDDEDDGRDRPDKRYSPSVAVFKVRPNSMHCPIGKEPAGAEGVASKSPGGGGGGPWYLAISDGHTADG